MKRFSIPSLVLMALIILSVCGYQEFMQKPLMLNTESINYVVKPGMNIKTISRDLEQRGLMSQPAWMFQLYARATRKAASIKAGEYQLQSGITLPELLTQLVEGKVLLHAFTIVEGLTVQQLLNSLADNPDIVKTLHEPSVSSMANALGLDKNGEGLFLPETYRFPAGTTDIDFLKRAYQQMQQKLQQAWEQRAENLPYKTPYEALIMASIIEKETAAADERPDIAGVFVRRLQKGMRLQTDPTVIYGLGDQFDGNLRKKDLRHDTPYNTYTRFGLPPTPICLPSFESIEAALHPAEGDSLYFVATGENGRHVFSSNLNDHNKAVRRYQIKKK